MYNRYQAVEYNTAVSRARTGKQWQQFDNADNRRLFPCIKWLPSRSATPREEHMPFYNRIWAKDDPFWNTNQPGTLWNCKCDWEQTDEDPTENNPNKQIIHKGLYGNPVRTGQIFTEDTEQPENNYSYARRIPKHIHIDDATAKKFPNLQNLLDINLKDYRLDYFGIEGGFLQTNYKRIEEGQQNKQERAKFEKEFNMCHTLAKNNYIIIYRESIQGQYDITINGIPADLKKVNSNKQIYHHARKAIEKQSAKAVIFELNKLDTQAWKELNKIKAKGWKCYFFTAENKNVRKL